MSQQFEDASREEANTFRRDRLTVAFVTSLVAMVMDVSERELLSRRRTNAIASRARQTAIYLVHIVLGWPLRRAAGGGGVRPRPDDRQPRGPADRGSSR